MLLETPTGWNDYELIDSGNFEKLERFGKFILIRPEPKALWTPTLSNKEWLSMAHTLFHYRCRIWQVGKKDAGTWNQLKKMPGPGG